MFVLLARAFALNRQFKKNKTPSLALEHHVNLILKVAVITLEILTFYETPQIAFHFWAGDRGAVLPGHDFEEADQPPLLGLLASNPGEQADR